MLDHSESSTSSAVMVGNDLNIADLDVDSFSVISDIIEDDYSFISWCGSSSGEIELAPAVRCYKHSRNVKLNKKLDLAVVFSFVLVVGLAIGNFIGRSSNCSEPCLDKLDCSAGVDPLMKVMHPQKAHISLKNKASYSSNIIKPPLTNGLKCMLNSTISSTPRSTEENDTMDVVQPVNSELISVEIHNGTSRSLLHDIILGEEPTTKDDILTPAIAEKYEIEVAINNDVMKHPEINLRIKEKISYADVLNILNNDIKYIVQKIQDLVSSLVSEENVGSNKLNQLHGMFNSFRNSVEKKTDELNEFVALSLFQNPLHGKKQFMKMSHSIIKSVDKLLKGSFIKALLKNEKPLSDRLETICSIGHDVMNGLEKRWGTQKKKLLHHVKKREIAKKRNPQNKERESSEYRKPKQYDQKNYAKPKFYKKKY